MTPFDNSANPFVDLNLCKDELVEAYIFFHDVDNVAQQMVIEAIDRKYTLEELFNIR